jgi:hypothetical protein
MNEEDFESIKYEDELLDGEETLSWHYANLSQLTRESESAFLVFLEEPSSDNLESADESLGNTIEALDSLVHYIVEDNELDYKSKSSALFELLLNDEQKRIKFFQRIAEEDESFFPVYDQWQADFITLINSVLDGEEDTEVIFEYHAHFIKENAQIFFNLPSVVQKYNDYIDFQEQTEENEAKKEQRKTMALIAVASFVGSLIASGVSKKLFKNT